jgi:hypothetical protein
MHPMMNGYIDSAEIQEINNKSNQKKYSELIDRERPMMLNKKSLSKRKQTNKKAKNRISKATKTKDQVPASSGEIIQKYPCCHIRGKLLWLQRKCLKNNTL